MLAVWVVVHATGISDWVAEVSMNTGRTLVQATASLILTCFLRICGVGEFGDGSLVLPKRFLKI